MKIKVKIREMTDLERPLVSELGSNILKLCDIFHDKLHKNTDIPSDVLIDLIVHVLSSCTASVIIRNIPLANRDDFLEIIRDIICAIPEWKSKEFCD